MQIIKAAVNRRKRKRNNPESASGSPQAVKRRKLGPPNSDTKNNRGVHTSQRVRRLTCYMTEDVSIGDLVELGHPADEHLHGERGVVKFIGEVHCLRFVRDPVFGHQYFGIELFKPLGDNDGTLQNQFYFSAKQKHGLFVQRDRIKKIVVLNYDVPRVTIDDVVYLPKFGCNGRIRYIGKLDIDNDQQRPNDSIIHYGLELSEERGNNNGYVNGNICFSQCRPNCGVFCTKDDLSDLLFMRKSYLLLSGFLRVAASTSNVDFIPTDIVNTIKPYFNWIRIEYYKDRHNSVPLRWSLRLITQLSSELETARYSMHDVFDMDGCIIGPMIWTPHDRKISPFEPELGIMINESQESRRSPKTVLKAMARLYGVTATELRQALEKLLSNSLHGVLFVPRESKLSSNILTREASAHWRETSVPRHTQSITDILERARVRRLRRQKLRK